MLLIVVHHGIRLPQATLKTMDYYTCTRIFFRVSVTTNMAFERHISLSLKNRIYCVVSALSNILL